MARYGDFEIGFSFSDIEDQFELEDVHRLMKRFNIVGEDDLKYKSLLDELHHRLHELRRSYISDTPEFFKRELIDLFGDVLNVST